MLRITTEKNGTLTKFRLEGRLKGAWVTELEHCWTYARSTRPETEYAVELSDVDFVDESGRALLSSMTRQGVTLLTNGNFFIACLVEEILHGRAAQVQELSLDQTRHSLAAPVVTDELQG
jgi:ABC-type transporter Mla MlaB component